MEDKRIPDYMQVLAERVHFLRRDKRWSQAELADHAEMSPTTLSNIEQAKARTITLEHFMGLVQVLGTTPNDLLGLPPGHVLKKG